MNEDFFAGLRNPDMPTVVNGKPWQCPDCGHDQLDEVITEVTISTRIRDLTMLDDTGDYSMEAGDTPDHDGYGSLYFECAKCHSQWSTDDFAEVFGHLDFPRLEHELKAAGYVFTMSLAGAVWTAPDGRIGVQDGHWRAVVAAHQHMKEVSP